MDEFLEQAWPAVLLALQEDIGRGDVTTLATIPAATHAKGRFLAKSSGIIAGLEVVALTYGLLEKGLLAPEQAGPCKQDGDSGARKTKPESVAGHRVQYVPCVEEGARVAAGTVIAHAAGRLRTVRSDSYRP